jgi:hypothetical protein
MRTSPAEIVLHNQVQTLSQLYIMLVSSLNPILIVGSNREEIDVKPNGLVGAARAATEVALIDVCGRISQLVNEPERWRLDNIDEMRMFLAQEQAAQMNELLSKLGVEVVEEKKTKRKKGGDEQHEQQQ